MKFNIPSPPRCVGNVKRDLPSIFEWCATAWRGLQALFSNIDNEQIVSVSADKIKSDVVHITDSTFRLGNSTSYIDFRDGVLQIVIDGQAVTGISNE